MVGKDVRDAAAILERAGLDLTTRKAEPSRQTKHTVLSQEPAAGKQVEKGTQATLVYTIPIEDRPAGVRTNVSIWYNDERERPTAVELATSLRSLFPEADFRVSLPNLEC